MSVIAAAVVLALTRVQADDANSPTVGVATIAVADCYKEQVLLLDDGVSGADVIAGALVNVCSKHLADMEEALRQKIVAMARSTDGLSKSEQRERNEKAAQLLRVVPQQMRKTMQDLALTTVLRARKKNANEAVN
jgi:tellurite resistance protein